MSNHYDNLIFIFWFYVVAILLILFTMLLFLFSVVAIYGAVGALLSIVLWLWFLIRTIKGMLILYRREPITDPKSFWNR